MVAVFILFSNVWIIGSTQDLIYNEDDLREAPTTVMLLGTSHKTMDGNDNPFFYERIKTATSLYQLGNIEKIILSGDHETRYYNEPRAMRTALVNSGVPDTILVSDGGGIRTLESVIRCKQVLKINEVIIVTQRFHAYRALFISKYYNLNAVVVITKPVPFSDSFAVLMREVLARPLAVIDLYLFNHLPDSKKARIN